jgi:hypothetical protein
MCLTFHDLGNGSGPQRDSGVKKEEGRPGNVQRRAACSRYASSSLQLRSDWRPWITCLSRARTCAIL